MLTHAKEYVEEHGGNPRDLLLAGQENSGSVWSISKMNLLLHGIPGAKIENDDTLASPRHVTCGKLDLFDRVLSNPPFSLNYTRDGMAHAERFRWGWAPEGGKKADLMFVQHMVAVLKGNGVAATVMPHGVLFRGRAEREIRTKLLDDDVIEAVIGLAPNLFYGTGIPPACSSYALPVRSHPTKSAGSCSAGGDGLGRRCGLVGCPVGPGWPGLPPGLVDHGLDVFAHPLLVGLVAVVRVGVGRRVHRGAGPAAVAAGAVADVPVPAVLAAERAGLDAVSHDPGGVALVCVGVDLVEVRPEIGRSRRRLLLPVPIDRHSHVTAGRCGVEFGPPCADPPAAGRGVHAGQPGKLAAGDRPALLEAGKPRLASIDLLRTHTGRSVRGGMRPAALPARCGSAGLIRPVIGTSSALTLARNSGPGWGAWLSAGDSVSGTTSVTTPTARATLVRTSATSSAVASRASRGSRADARRYPRPSARVE